MIDHLVCDLYITFTGYGRFIRDVKSGKNCCHELSVLTQTSLVHVLPKKSFIIMLYSLLVKFDKNNVYLPLNDIFRI